MARDPLDPGTRELAGIGRVARAKPQAAMKKAQPIQSTRVGELIGYGRVSTDDQNLALQRDALNDAGCVQIYEEHASGGKRDRVELSNCLKALRPGDTLVVWRLDRLGRNISHLVELVNELRLRNVGLRSLCEREFDTSTAHGSLIFGIFAIFAEYESNSLKERTRAGLKAARARGRKGGRPQALTAGQKVRIAALVREGTISLADIAKDHNISRTTLYNHLKRMGERNVS